MISEGRGVALDVLGVHPRHYRVHYVLQRVHPRHYRVQLDRLRVHCEIQRVHCAVQRVQLDHLRVLREVHHILRETLRETLRKIHRYIHPRHQSIHPRHYRVHRESSYDYFVVGIDFFLHDRAVVLVGRILSAFCFNSILKIVVTSHCLEVI